MNGVLCLLEKPFLTRDPIQQTQILAAGRPLPTLKMANLEVVDGNTIVHYFNSEIYKKNDWICGCTGTNSFFCFPCLLFGGDDAWSSTGFANLVHLTNASSKHELSPVHMQNTLKYSKYSKNSRDPTECVQHQNTRAERNLDVLEAIIDTVKFCAFNSIPIFDQSELIENSFDDIFMLTIPSDLSVKNYLQKEPFDDLATLKMDILKAVADVVRDQIIEEVRAARFLALIVEVGDIQHPRIIILRYLKGCDIVERIWKLVNVESMNRFLDILLGDLRIIVQDPTVLISQSIDQMPLKKQDPVCKLYSKIQTYFSQAQLVHFYGHDLFHIIYGVSGFQKLFQEFCGVVWGISELLTHSEKIKTTFEEVRNRLYATSEKKIKPPDFTNNKIESVYLYWEVILQTLKTVLAASSNYPDNHVCLADSFLLALQDKLNVYLLETFYKMIPHFQKMLTDYESCVNPTYNPSIEDIRLIIDAEAPEAHDQEQQEVQVKRENDLEIHEVDLTSVKTESPDYTIVPYSQPLPTTSKRKWDDEFLDKKRETTVKIVHSVLIQIQELLKYRGNMYVSQLIDPKNFERFSTIFPENFVTTALAELHFFSAFEGMKLRNELKVLYDQSDFQSLSSSCDVLREICEKKLTPTFPETIKLLKTGLTFPSTTNDPKRCFDTKMKVQRFLKDSQGFKHLDCLVYFDCERELVDSIEDFNKKVIHKVLKLRNRAEHFEVVGFKG